MNFIKYKNQPYTTSNYIVKTFNITTDRLKKWKDGRGLAKIHPLRYIELEGSIFLYNLDDIKLLKIEHQKIYGSNPTIYDENDDEYINQADQINLNPEGLKRGE